MSELLTKEELTLSQREWDSIKLSQSLGCSIDWTIRDKVYHILARARDAAGECEKYKNTADTAWETVKRFELAYDAIREENEQLKAENKRINAILDVIGNMEVEGTSRRVKKRV